MGYQTKIQVIKRAKGADQYYVNFPMVMAEALEFQKGETVEWIVAEGGEIVLARPEMPSRTIVKKTETALKVEKS